MKSNLSDVYKFKTELHCHSLPVSLCSKVYAPELAALYKKRGADTIVLTNHFTPVHAEGISKDEMVSNHIKAYRDLKKEAEKLGMNAIFGMELRFIQNINDYLVFGIDEDDTNTIYDYMQRSIEEFYAEFKNEKNCIIQAHPFRNNMTLVSPDVLDGIEVFNMHPEANSRIAVAARYAKENNLLITGGTDFHFPDNVGCCLTCTGERLETSFDVAKIIKEQDFVLDMFGTIISTEL